MSATKEASTKELVKKEQQATALATYDYGEDAGLGFAGQTNEDGKTPYLSILQGLSPQISKKVTIPVCRFGELSLRHEKRTQLETGTHCPLLDFWCCAGGEVRI